METNKVQKFWNMSADNYDRTEERFEYTHHTSRESTKSHLKDSDVVLDYGCGTGTTSIALAGYVKEIQAIDISDKMIKLSKEKANAASIKNVSFVQGDIFDKGRYSKNSFDVILAFNMLHTVPNPQDTVRKINGLLKPDGLFISVTPCFKNKKSFIFIIFTQLMRFLCFIGVISIPIRRVKSSDLDNMIKNGEFETIESKKITNGVTSYFIVAKKIY